MFVQKLMAGYIHATTIVSLNAMAPCSALLNEIYEDLSLSLSFLSFSSAPFPHPRTFSCYENRAEASPFVISLSTSSRR